MIDESRIHLTEPELNGNKCRYVGECVAEHGDPDDEVACRCRCQRLPLDKNMIHWFIAGGGETNAIRKPLPT